MSGEFCWQQRNGTSLQELGKCPLPSCGVETQKKIIRSVFILYTHWDHLMSTACTIEHYIRIFTCKDCKNAPIHNNVVQCKVAGYQECTTASSFFCIPANSFLLCRDNQLSEGAGDTGTGTNLFTASLGGSEQHLILLSSF